MTSPTPPTVFTKTPSELIRTLIRADWTQEQIAHTVNVSQATICRIYSGKHKDPRYSVVLKLQHLVLNVEDFDRVA